MKAIIHRSPRYLAVSLFCVVLSNTILIGTSWLGFSSAAAVFMSAAVLVPTGFFLQARVTFAAPPTWASFIRYATALALNIPLSWLVLFVVHDQIGIDIRWAAPLATILLFVWTYLVSAWALDRWRPDLTERKIA